MVGSDRSGSKFDQKKIGGSNRAITEQLGQKKIRDWVGVCEQVIGEKAIGGRDFSGSDCSEASNQVSRDWGASDC